MVCLFVCVVDRGENEGEPANEQYYEPVNEDQFRDPEPEGQYLDQDFSEGFENGKFNPTLWCMFCPSFIIQPIGLFYKIAYVLTAENTAG